MTPPIVSEIDALATILRVTEVMAEILRIGQRARR